MAFISSVNNDAIVRIFKVTLDKRKGFILRHKLMAYWKYLVLISFLRA